MESVRQRDMYGYELVEEVSQVIDVNEGTILYRDRLTAEWDEFQTRVNEFLKGRDGRE